MSDTQFPPPPPGSPMLGGYSLTDWVQDNLATVISIVVVVLLCIGAGIGVSQWLSGKNEAAQARLSEITTEWLQGDKTQTRSVVDQLTAYLADGPPGIAGDMALVLLGQAQEELGSTVEAQASFQSGFDAPEPLGSVARMRLAYLKASTGDLPGAERLFQEVMQRSPGLAPQAALEMGRLAEMVDNTEMAVARYTEVTEKYPTSLQSGESRARMRKLGVSPEPKMSLPDFADVAPVEVPDAEPAAGDAAATGAKE